MVVGAFPLAKLGTLLIRQISKPIAGYIKEGAKRSSMFRNYVCLPTAQFYHWAEIRWKMWVMGFGKPAQVTPLTEQMAVDLGADILGEVFIFGTAAALLTAEYMRSSASAKAKEEAAARRLEGMEAKLVELDLLIEQQRAQMRELERNMYSSPLRALKEKFTGGGGGGGGGESTKTDQKVSTIAAPPGPESAKDSQRVPEKTPVGSKAAPSTSKNGSTPSGTVSAVHSVAAAPSLANGISNDNLPTPTHDKFFTPKMVRRTLKILFDAYEEAFEDDD